MGNGFTDPKNALWMRDLIERVGLALINKERPAAFTGEVMSIDSERRKAYIRTVGTPDDGVLVEANYTSTLGPASPRSAGFVTGNIAEVSGKPGSYWISKIIGGDILVSGKFVGPGSWPTIAPPGSINQYAGSTAPLGWLIADGSAVSRTDYADLFAVCGTTYGSGDGSTTFNLPNLKGRVPVGRDSSQTEFDTLGESAGEKSHTLTIAEMPSHNHSGNTGSSSVDADDSLNIASTNPSGGTARFARGGTTTTGTNTLASSSHNHSISSQGGGTDHNNLQPYVVLNYIVKI